MHKVFCVVSALALAAFAFSADAATMTVTVAAKPVAAHHALHARHHARRHVAKAFRHATTASRVAFTKATSAGPITEADRGMVNYIAGACKQQLGIQASAEMLATCTASIVNVDQSKYHTLKGIQVSGR